MRHVKKPWIFHSLARQQLFKRENLNSRIPIFQPSRLVETGFGSFFPHGLGRCSHVDQNANLSLFAFDHAAQVADVGSLQLPGLRIGGRGLEKLAQAFFADAVDEFWD